MSNGSTDRRISRRRFVAAATTGAAGASLAGAAAAGDREDSTKQPPQGKSDSASCPGREAEKPEPEKPKARLRLHVVGAGVPPPTRTRHGSAFLLQVNDECLMVDCGPATTYKMARMGIGPKRVHHVFLTHHHFDHNVDFPCFALVRWDLCHGREPPLRVYGPPPTRSFVERLIGPEGVFFPDIHARVKHPVSVMLFRGRGGEPPRPAPSFEARDVEPGKVEQTDAWTATAARVHHVEPWLISLAYRFDTSHGSIVFAGDCGDCPELRALAEGADTLVIACVAFGTAKRYEGIITGTQEVGDIAKAAGVRRVVLTHAPSGLASPSGKKRAIGLVAEAFDGEVLFPEELTTLDLAATGGRGTT